MTSLIPKSVQDAKALALKEPRTNLSMWEGAFPKSYLSTLTGKRAIYSSYRALGYQHYFWRSAMLTTALSFGIFFPLSFLQWMPWWMAALGMNKQNPPTWRKEFTVYPS